MTPNDVRVVRWEQIVPLTEEEAEAKLHKEGYECFRWHDVAGSTYPRHRHEQDECLWVIKGEIAFTVDGQEHLLKPGDRLYLPSRIPHTARVPSDSGATYLVGQKPKD